MSGSIRTVLLWLFIFMAGLAIMYYVYPTLEKHRNVFQKKDLHLVQSEDTHSPEEHLEKERDSLALGEQALRNIGITSETLKKIEVTSFGKSFTFPGMVADRPGRTRVKIPSTVSGVISRIYCVPGEFIKAGAPLFDIMLTHEDTVRCQSELITLLKKRDLAELELKRLEDLPQDLAPKSKRDAAFNKLEIDSAIQTQRNLLILDGLPEELIREKIEGKREIVRHITIFLPEIEDDIIETPDAHIHECEHHHQLDELRVEKGQQVELGTPLCVVTDMENLMIEGKIFAYHEGKFRAALKRGSTVTATFSGEGNQRRSISGLIIRSVDNRVDPTSRTLTCYIQLENTLDGELLPNKNGKRFLNWRYKPGERCELKLEYEVIPECIVLPVYAVAENLNNVYVYEWTGMDGTGAVKNRVWTQREVHILYRNKEYAILANDGAIMPGATVAGYGASQLEIAFSSGSGKLQSACPCGNH